MPNMYKQILIALIASIPFSMINFSAYVKGDIPSLYQALGSILFLALWFVYGLVLSYRKQPVFLRAATLYWGIGATVYALGYVMNLAIILLPVTFLIPGPIYGVRYFLDLPANFTLAILSIGIAYSSAILGYWVGKVVRAEESG